MKSLVTLVEQLGKKVIKKDSRENRRIEIENSIYRFFLKTLRESTSTGSLPMT